MKFTEKIELQNIWAFIFVVLILFTGSVMFFGRNNPALTGNWSANIVLPSSNARTAREYTVFYKKGVFSPTNIRIHEGDSVIFRNDDGVTVELSGSFMAQNKVLTINPRQSVSHVFSKEGTFNYKNSVNENEKGAVIVRSTR